MSKLYHLPDDIVIHIFQYLRFTKDLLFTLEQVSHQFYAIVSSDQYWKPVFNERYNNACLASYRSAYVQLHHYVKMHDKILTLEEKVINLTLLGDREVGRTSIVLSYTHSRYIEEFDPFIDGSYRKQILIGSTNYALDIDDYTQREEFSWPRYHHIINGHCFIIVFDLTRKETFDNVHYFFDRISKLKRVEVSKVPVILVGTKADLENDRQVARYEIEEFSKARQVPYMEVSAKNIESINNLFNTIIDMTYPKLVTLFSLCEKLGKCIPICENPTIQKKKKCRLM